MDAINTGLQLSLYGILITFLALGLLILVISLLQALFPASKQAQETPANPDQPPAEQAGREPTPRTIALAAAWWYWHEKRSSSLGQQLEQGPGKRWRKDEKA